MQEQFDPIDIEKNKLMAILCYIGILVIIPFMMVRDSKYIRFHVNQGCNLLIAGVILGVFNKVVLFIMAPIPVIGTILVLISAVVGVGLSILALLGIINVIQGKVKELPFIGKFRFLK